jgi:hypothetical protein
MCLPKNLVTVFLFIIGFHVDASVTLVFKFTEQGYWYGKAYNIMLCGYGNSELPHDIVYESSEDLYSILSPAETLCFLSGILREGHPALNKLIVWKYVKNNKLKISQRDTLSLRTDNSIFKTHMETNKWLLEKMEKFWGLRNKNIYFYCFYSRPNEKQPHFSGAWLANFVYGNDVYSSILMCGPSLASKKMTLNEHLSVLAHEFSHAMCDAALGRENFEKMTAKSSTSPNAIVAGWYINEALAVILGNCIFQETVSQKRVDPQKEEYCAKGFVPALYKLTKDYFDKSKTIDESFLKNAVKIFDKVHPNGYKDPNLCLYKVYAIYPDNIEGNRIIMQLSQKTTVSSFYCTAFSKLTGDEIKEIENKDSTLLVIFSDKKQVTKLKKMLPQIDCTINISIIRKNNRTYIFMPVDDKHSLEDCINELFSKANN